VIYILENGHPPSDKVDISDLSYILTMITAGVTDEIISDSENTHSIRDSNSPSPSINSKMDSNDSIILVSHNIAFLLG